MFRSTHWLESKVEIALTEAEVKYKAYQIDLWDKPEWYTPRVNPAGKVTQCSTSSSDYPSHQILRGTDTCHDVRRS